MVFAVTGCGPNPQLDFIRVRPENDLVYPGATLLSTKTYPGAGIPAGGASIEREFSSSASTDDIVAWYRTEPSNRNWSGGVLGDSGNSYAATAAWFYPGLLLQLDFRAPANGTLRYLMTFSSTPEYDVSAQIQTLRETPEETLAPPGAQGEAESWWRIKQTDASAARIRVHRTYALDSTSSDIERFYDSELAARGWTSMPPPTSDPDGAPPMRTWQKGTVTALLFVTGTYGTDEYEFALDQTLDSAGSPVAP
jgi:hypothetical protein